MKPFGTYLIAVECSNCGFKNKLYCKKGVTVRDFVQSDKCRCKNCGCVITVKEYSTEFIK